MVGGGNSYATKDGLKTNGSKNQWLQEISPRPRGCLSFSFSLSLFLSSSLPLCLSLCLSLSDLVGVVEVDDEVKPRDQILSLALSLSLSLLHTHTHTQTLSPSLPHALSLSLTHSLALPDLVGVVEVGNEVKPRDEDQVGRHPRRQHEPKAEPARDESSTCRDVYIRNIDLQRHVYI